MSDTPIHFLKSGIFQSTGGHQFLVDCIYEGDLDNRYKPHYNKPREAFNLLNANLKYEISQLYAIDAPVITLEIDGYNLLNQEIWLPPVGLALFPTGPFTGPEIQGISVYFGVTLGF